MGRDIKRLDNCGQYWAKDNRGGWHYLNHADTWQSFQGPSVNESLFNALKGAIGALEFSRDFHHDLGNEEQAFAQDKLDLALSAIAEYEGHK